MHRTHLASGFVQKHAGYRIRRVFSEAADQLERDFLGAVRSSSSFSRIIQNLDEQIIFDDSRVCAGHSWICWQHSFQKVYTCASPSRFGPATSSGCFGRAATDLELASEIGVTLSAIKARWRSAFARIEETMPEVVPDLDYHGVEVARSEH